MAAKKEKTETMFDTSTLFNVGAGVWRYMRKPDAKETATLAELKSRFGVKTGDIVLISDNSTAMLLAVE